MEKKRLIFESRAKRLYETGDADVLIMEFKDDDIVFGDLGSGKSIGKGYINNVISNHMMHIISSIGIPTHFIREVSEKEAAIKRLDMFPISVTVRNMSAGSFSIRYGLSDGAHLANPVVEFNLRSEALACPFISESAISAVGLATVDEVKTLAEYSLRINDLLKERLKDVSVDLVDFKLEFGKDSTGTIVLGDEISPDTCRLWDSVTHEKLDKGRYCRNIEAARAVYKEILSRLTH